MRNRPGLNIFPCSHQLHITLTLLRPQTRFTPNDTERHHQIWFPFIPPQKIVILGWRVGTLYLLSCWRWWVNQFRGGVASKGPRPILLLLLSLHPMIGNTLYSKSFCNCPLLLDGYIPSWVSWGFIADRIVKYQITKPNRNLQIPSQRHHMLLIYFFRFSSLIMYPENLVSIGPEFESPSEDRHIDGPGEWQMGSKSRCIAVYFSSFTEKPKQCTMYHQKTICMDVTFLARGWSERRRGGKLLLGIFFIYHKRVFIKTTLGNLSKTF